MVKRKRLKSKGLEVMVHYSDDDNSKPACIFMAINDKTFYLEDAYFPRGNEVIFDWWYTPKSELTPIE